MGASHFLCVTPPTTFPFLPTTSAAPILQHVWDWTADTVADFTMGTVNTNKDAAASSSFLSLTEIADMRVRDIKQRLARSHRYGADELGRMILKKELVETLAFEEEKVRLRSVDQHRRYWAWRGIGMAIVVVLVVACWPLLQQGYEVALVNFVVYTDRKQLEVTRCREWQSKWGMLGVTLMFMIDILQAWLTLSIVLSWVIRPNRYFFLTPNIPIKPAQFMGGPMDKAFGSYGINIGSMLVTWGLRFAHGQLETWTGKALARSRQRMQQTKKKKTKITNEGHGDFTAETTTQSDLRRQARREAQQQAATTAAATTSQTTTTTMSAPPAATSTTSTALDELD